MIEESLRLQLLTKPTVTALVGNGSDARIRPYKLWQKDDLENGPAIIVRVNREEHQNDMDDTGGLVIGDVSIVACAETLRVARSVSEAVRLNGGGGGLAGDEWNAAGVEVAGCALTYSQADFVSYGDDSDEGFYVVDSHYTVSWYEGV